MARVLDYHDLFLQTTLLPVTVDVIWGYVFDSNDPLKKKFFYQPNAQFDLDIIVPDYWSILTNAAVSTRIIVQDLWENNRNNTQNQMALIQNCIRNANVAVCFHLLGEFPSMCPQARSSQKYMKILMNLLKFGAITSMERLCTVMEIENQRTHHETWNVTQEVFLTCWSQLMNDLCDGLTMEKVGVGPFRLKCNNSLRLKNQILMAERVRYGYAERGILVRRNVLLTKIFKCEILSAKHRSQVALKVLRKCDCYVDYIMVVDEWDDVFFNINLMLTRLSTSASVELIWLDFVCNPRQDWSWTQITAVVTWLLDELLAAQFLELKEPFCPVQHGPTDNEILHRLDTLKSQAGVKSLARVKLRRIEWQLLLDLACKMPDDTLVKALLHYADLAINLSYGWLHWPTPRSNLRWSTYLLLLGFFRVVDTDGIQSIIQDIIKCGVDPVNRICYILDLDLGHWPIPATSVDWWKDLCMQIRKHYWHSHTQIIKKNARFAEIINMEQPPFASRKKKKKKKRKMM